MKTSLLSFLLFLAGMQLHAQARAIPMPFVKATFLDQNGKPCVSCLAWTYAAGTTTVQDSYTTSVGNVANTNPVVLNASGQADIFLGVASYKFVFETAPLPAQTHGTVLWTEDNIPGSTSSSLTEYTAPFSNSVPRTINSKLADTVSALDFGVDNTGVTDATADLNHAVASGHPVYMPCGTYFTSGPITLANPTAGLIGENQACVIWNYVGTASPIIWQMSPFTQIPAGIVANLTINGTSSAQAGILTGNMVGATFANLSINGFAASAGRGIDIHNTDSYHFDRNTFSNINLGYQAANSYGIYLEQDGDGSFFNNYFSSVSTNVSTGTIGLRLQSGVWSHSLLDLTCNLDNAVAGTVGPICIDTNSNWNNSVTNLLGQYLLLGSGTGTPYSVQVESGASFSNDSGTVNVYNPSGVQLAVNNLAGSSGAPTVTMHQPSQPDWDTGAFTLGSLGPLSMWTAIRDNGAGSLGLLEGANAGSPFVTMNNVSGNQFIVGTVNPGSALGTMTSVFSVDIAGSITASGNISGNGNLGIPGNANVGNLVATGTASASVINDSGTLSVTGKSTLSGGIASGGLITQSGGNDDNDGAVSFNGSTTSNPYTMTGTYTTVFCTGNIINGSFPGVTIDTSLVGGHWQVSLQSTGTVASGVSGVYHCRLIP